MSHARSPLDAARAAYLPRVPPVLGAGLGRAAFVAVGPVGSWDEEIRALFPRTYGGPLLLLEEQPGALPSPEPLHAGVVLSGGQAPGGHNVIAGLLDGLLALHRGSRLTGFLGGPRGVVRGHCRELSAAEIAPYRNSGGFDLLGSGRDKIETDEALAACRATVERLGLTGLVVVGGDDSNTNAAVLAEYFLSHGLSTSVVGVPKTIDGDLKGDWVETSFGFDTATKVYSELIGNICRDAKSAGKYWHFVKLMGRSASHVTLECALQTHPNVALIGEEVAAAGRTLSEIVDDVAGVIRRRAENGRNYGVCLIPEGLIEFIPEMRRLIDALNQVLAGPDAPSSADPDPIAQRLPPAERQLFDALPGVVREQLVADRDAHGNVQVSRIDTERLLILEVEARIAAWKRAGLFPAKFAVQGHFFGYEGRCALPSDFDADYTYGVGRLAAALLGARVTGYICALGGLAQAPESWVPTAVPLTSMLQMESRRGRRVPVIGKALVRLDQAPFAAFATAREAWAVEDAYRYPGPIQYFGPAELTRATTETLRLEHPPDV